MSGTPLNFNTSNVTIQRVEEKYLTYLKQYFNTSNVTIQRGFDCEPSNENLLFQYI